MPQSDPSHSRRGHLKLWLADSAGAHIEALGWGMARRASEVELALVGGVPDDKRLREACESCRKLEAIDDVHASSAYRQHLATVMARRALEQACVRLPSRAAARAH